MNKNLRIVFLGTPDFAAASLKALVESDVNVVAVITAPDRPKGRGKKLGTSAVKDYALEAGLPVIQPTNLKAPTFLEELRAYKGDLQIVVAFRMLPEVVWNMPPLGTFNLHASLLPQYRGAAPINWAIINGEKETGVTTFFLKHEIDTGAIVFQEKEPIEAQDNVGTLYHRLMNRGAALVLKTVRAIEDGDFPQTPQKANESLKSAPKIFKEDCKINWNRPSGEIINFVRGLSPYPAAWSTLNEKSIKVFEVELYEGTEDQVSALPVGSFHIVPKKAILVRTSDHVLSITDLQMEGKRRIKTVEFLKGYNTTA